jgi:hypothetical protein
MVIPLLVLLTAVLAWMVAVGVAQVRAVDAARETARSFARGDARATSVDLGQRIAPPGADIRIREDGGEVVVTVRAEVRGPGQLLGFLPGRSIEVEAVTVSEQKP